MKKFFLAIIVLVGVFTACVGNKVDITGAWVEPIPGMTGEQGIKIEEGGIASSINMATLVYESWKQEGDQLFLKGKSIGNGGTFEFTDTMKIQKLTVDSLILNNRGMTIRYNRK